MSVLSQELNSDKQYRSALKYCYHYRNFEEELSKLNRFWDSISTIGSINQDLLQGHGTPLLESMRETRSDFTGLQSRLLQSLIGETQSKTTSELSFFAQNTIDILIRNLFERTADVGYLSVDEDVRTFLSSPDKISSTQMRNRLQAYVAKYSVYDEILILDSQGKLKAHLNANNTGIMTDRNLINRIDSADEYLEYFGYSSFYPARHSNHVFASKIYSGDAGSSECLGYLVMFFRFEDEMKRIYSQMLKGRDEVTLLLLDEKQSVKSTSNADILPVGQSVSDFDGELSRPMVIDDTEYLSITLPSTGYQGYFGLGWTARALIPVKVAMDVKLEKRRSHSDENNFQDLVLSDSLSKIYEDSRSINRKLRIVTVNGKSLAARLEVRTFVPILEKIQEVGNEMTEIIAASIGMLSQTVLNAVLSDCRLYSSLAIDIMDRNLYERANDCRWWALTPIFIDALQAITDKRADAQTREGLTETLQYINELYTVYTNIIVFGSDGTVIACSQDDPEKSLIGKKLSDANLVMRTVGLNSHQSYMVSDFEPYPEYDDKHTYIYSAAVKGEAGRTIAGVGVVFDAEPEFKAMLEAALPRDAQGHPVKGAGGLYVSPNGKVLSSSDERFAVGQSISLPFAISSLRNGEGYEGVVTLEGHTLLLGATASHGYREYKTTGDYENNVIGIIFVDPEKEETIVEPPELVEESDLVSAA